MGRGAVLPRRRRARYLAASAAYLASAALVAERGLAGAMLKTFRARQALRCGARRSSERALAQHLAREAFGIPLGALSRVSGGDRSLARKNSLAVWDRRDRDPEFDALVCAAILDLNTGRTRMERA